MRYYLRLAGNRVFLAIIGFFIVVIAMVVLFEISSQTKNSLLEWEKLGGLPGGVVMSISASKIDPDIVYAVMNVDDMGVWKSEDFGRTWEKIHKEGHSKAILAHPNKKNIAYLLGKHGDRLWRTIDGGNKWNVIKRYERRLNSLNFYESNPDIMVGGTREGITISKDKGETWQEKKISFKNVGDEILTVFIMPGNPDVLYAGGSSIFKSVDGGESWIESFVFENGGFVKDIEGDLSGTGVIYAATSRGVFITDDEGESWKNRGLKLVNDITIVDKVLYAAANNGIYKSKNGGETWEEIKSSIEDAAFVLVQKEDVSRMIGVSAGWETWSRLGRQYYRAGPYFNEGIFFSEDGGQTWGKSRHFYDTDVFTIAINGSTLFAGTECSRGAFRSLDEGKSWHYLEVGIPGAQNQMHYTMDIYVDAEFVLMTGRDSSFVSYDNGDTWEILPIPGHSHGIFVDEDLILIGQSHYDNKTGLKTRAHIWKSEDKGKTWRVSEKGFPGGAKTEIKVIIKNESDRGIYLTTFGHKKSGAGTKDELQGVGLGIYRSFDNGETWARFNKGLESLDVNDITIVEGVVYAAMHDGFYRSDGKQWIQMSEYNFRDVAYDQRNKRFYAAQGRFLMQSKDGILWEDVPGGWPKNERWPKRDRIEQIKIMNGKLYVAVGQGGIYVAAL